VDLLINEVMQNDYNYLDLVNKLIDHKHLLSGDLQSWLANKRKIRPFRYLPTKAICETTDICAENIQIGIDHGREIASNVLKDY
jgi:hypothetical protein